VNRFIILNLFLGCAIELFFDAKKENEAIIRPHQLEEFVKKWGEFDQDGSGFIEPQDYIFILYDLPPPIGLKDEDAMPHQTPDKITDNKKDLHLKSPWKKIVLTKKQVLNTLKEYNVPIYRYAGKIVVHYRDAVIRISQNAVCFKYKLMGLE
jgi:hypothetical protein